MASWIVHLRIAEIIHEHIPGLDAAQFAIGNIGPDSGVPDENHGTFDPPTRITHFQPQESADGFRSEDLRFYRKYLAEVSLESDPERFSFLLGYFFHLVTDNMWGAEITTPTMRAYHQQFEDDPDFIWEVKRDWYGLDLAHVRTDPDGIFWRVFLPAEYTAHYLDFFPPEAIPNHLEYVKAYYQRRDEEVENKLRLSNNIYLNKQEMDAFVEDASQTILTIFEKIWNQGVSLTDQGTALELVEYLYAD